MRFVGSEKAQNVRPNASSVLGVNTMTNHHARRNRQDYPDQRLGLFRDRDTSGLCAWGKQGKKYAVFYIGSDGQKFCWHCAIRLMPTHRSSPPS